MPDLTTIIQASTAHAWVYLPVAILLGAMHALEPGHAKSLMAAYIVAIRGTAAQAVVLATSAAVGHTIVVWGLPSRHLRWVNVTLSIRQSLG
jgi:nickel/cobalt exporter